MIAAFKARSDGLFEGKGLRARCSVGRAGVIPADEKREGDGASPIGIWTMRRVFFRPDRLAAPKTALETVPLRPFDGWCDDPRHALYNRPVSRPFNASHERLWRDDGVYDVIVQLGHNDDPVVAGLGSAIFFHLSTPDYAGTEGCVAVSKTDMLNILLQCGPGSSLEIAP